MAYTKQWSSNNPGCLIVLLDQSGSMSGTFGGTQIGAGKRKCDMVATVLNNLLNEFVKANTVGPDVKPRADVAVLGYGPGNVRSALSGPLAKKEFVSLPELINAPLRVEQRSRKEVDEMGTLVEVPVYFPVWVEPLVGNGTPMCAALKEAKRLAQQWVKRHPDRYPPVVINITDGGSTDGDPTRPAHDLTSVSTQDGQTLLLNCHITDSHDQMVEFPADSSTVPNDQLAQLLFSLSSPIPESARSTILNVTGQPLPAGARGFIFNGDANSVRQMFVFATVGATNPAVDPNR